LVNPATEEPFGRAAAAAATDVDRAVGAARATFDSGPWSRLSMHEHAATLSRFADALEAAIEPLAAVDTIETGQPSKDSIGGTKAMTRVLRYYADIADDVGLVERRTGRTGITASIEKMPIGGVAQVVPWNTRF
jgi:acyl-CoA reductase-like NAD-dependent aldehyde dehydrogenase